MLYSHDKFEILHSLTRYVKFVATTQTLVKIVSHMLLVLRVIELITELAEKVCGCVAHHLCGALVCEREPPVHRVPRHELHAAAAQAVLGVVGS